MELTLKNIKINKTGQYKGKYTETFNTDHPRIKTVNYTYIGTEEDLDNFFKTTIVEYVKRKNKWLTNRICKTRGGNIINKTSETNIEKQILLTLNKQILDDGLISEEVYLKAKTRIEKMKDV